ncbi:hypothetical protein ES705_15344 [subsurface metagenome]
MRARVLTLGLVFLLVLGSVLSAEKKKKTNPWQELFTEPIEKVYIIMKDKKGFEYTSHDEIKVHMRIGMLKEKLENRGYSIQDIAIVIHNHRRNKNFTRSDYKQYWMLKGYGFDGRFLLYCHRNKKVYDIEEKGPIPLFQSRLDESNPLSERV